MVWWDYLEDSYPRETALSREMVITQRYLDTVLACTYILGWNEHIHYDVILHIIRGTTEKQCHGYVWGNFKLSEGYERFLLRYGNLRRLPSDILTGSSFF